MKQGIRSLDTQKILTINHILFKCSNYSTARTKHKLGTTNQKIFKDQNQVESQGAKDHKCTSE